MKERVRNDLGYSAFPERTRAILFIEPAVELMEGESTVLVVFAVAPGWRVKANPEITFFAQAVESLGRQRISGPKGDEVSSSVLLPVREMADGLSDRFVGCSGWKRLSILLLTFELENLRKRVGQASSLPSGISFQLVLGMSPGSCGSVLHRSAGILGRAGVATSSAGQAGCMSHRGISFQLVLGMSPGSCGSVLHRSAGSLGACRGCDFECRTSKMLIPLRLDFECRTSRMLIPLRLGFEFGTSRMHISLCELRNRGKRCRTQRFSVFFPNSTTWLERAAL